MAQKKQKTINTIAPVLRILLLPKEGSVPIVRHLDNKSDSNAAVLDVASLAFDELAQIVEALRTCISNLEQACHRVTVPEVGTFDIIPSPISSNHTVAGKVAVVTGASQGFGLEIAQHLAADGAMVAMADINLEGAQRAAEQIQNERHPEAAFAVKVDVTSRDSVQEMVDQVVNRYGGFDLFVANAGVLLAEGVKTQPEKDFDFVTAVNYKGYYLCAQAAAPILATQHIANPKYMGDIVQINSKSGLRGSNRNFAYAGSKFGAIGLTESFALELIADGIKVNSICPGNFLDGPLWSDPENGLFVQYLRTGKVPGARTVEDVRRFYETKVPMGRGCRTEDVMKALYYLVEQQYETGQALPVTGGQVMLK